MRSVQHSQPDLRESPSIKQAVERGFGLWPFTRLSFKNGLMHFISLADDQWGKGSQGSAMKNKCLFLLVKIRWPILSASHTLLELCFYLRYHHFSTAHLFYEARLSYRQSHSLVLLDIVQFSHRTNMFPTYTTPPIMLNQCQHTACSIWIYKYICVARPSKLFTFNQAQIAIQNSSRRQILPLQFGFNGSWLYGSIGTVVYSHYVFGAV